MLKAVSVTKTNPDIVPKVLLQAKKEAVTQATEKKSHRNKTWNNGPWDDGHWANRK
ncbi:hypothetical protein KKH14_00345 [Patescibacteria group bacterium]|nr:hypothetical protein [Patescibacteria group bacterium]